MLVFAFSYSFFFFFFFFFLFLSFLCLQIVLRPCTPEFNAYSTIEKWVVNLKARLTSQVSLSVSEVGKCSLLLVVYYIFVFFYFYSFRYLFTSFFHAAIPQIQQLQLGKMVSGVANALAPSIYQIRILIFFLSSYLFFFSYVSFFSFFSFFSYFSFFSFF